MNKIKLFLIKWSNDIDFIFIERALILFTLGILASGISSPAIAERINTSRFYFFNRHVIFVIIAIFVMLIFSMFSLNFIFKLSKYAVFIFLFSILLTILNGNEIKGSKRWLNLGFFTLQPTELLKPFFFIANGVLISGQNNILIRFTISLLLIISLCGLCLLQPDVGMTFLYLMTWCAQVFLSKTRIEIFFLLPTATFGMLAFAYKNLNHFKYRIDTFLNENKHQYQVNKSISCIEEGGLFGKGFGEGTVKYQLPDSHTDYVMSVLAEEFGLFLYLTIIFIYSKIVFRILFLNYKTSDSLKLNIILTFATLLTMELFINIGVNLNFLPSKGAAMPFISYGGSSILSTAIILGSILALTRKDYKFKSKFHYE